MATETNLRGRLNGPVSMGLLAVGLVALALPGTAAAEGGKRDPFKRCAAISDNEARLACFDAVSIALEQAKASAARPADPKAAEAARRAAQEAEALRREAAAREAAVAAREAELARREAELVRRQAEIAAEQARLEAARLEAAAQDDAARAEAEVARQAAAERARAAEEARRAAEARALEADGKAAEARRLEDAAGAPATRPAEEEAAADPAADFGAEDLKAQRRKEEKARKKDKADDGDEANPDEVTLKVERYRYNNVGKVVVFLENGQVWRQKEGSRVVLGSRGPETVRLRKGWLGGYFMHFDGKGKGIRAERIK